MSVKEEIEKLLRETNRPGMEDLLDYMEVAGFYEAPASTRYHGAEAGALAVHSLNVCNCAIDLANAWCGEEWVKDHINSVIICALLHDLGKAGQYWKPLYVENILKKGRSEAQPFKHNDDLLTLDHEIVSVIEASRYIRLSDEEQFAIAYHNGLYTAIGKYNLAGKERPLQMIIHFADLWTSRVIEREVTE
jgi:23S rRNA maturation-related 3'-5' exoribonuclease YhaM